MKTLHAFIAVLLCVASLLSTAQTATPPLNEPDYNKPRIFADLPEKLSLRLTDAAALLDLAVGSSVEATIANGFTVAGTVVSKTSPANATVQSVVIKSKNRHNATFTFTRFKGNDGTFSYAGRMWCKTAGDALQIIKEGGTYIIRKQGLYDLVNE